MQLQNTLEARKRKGVMSTEIAYSYGSETGASTIQAFETGKANLDLKRVVDAARDCNFDDDPNIIEIEHMLKEQQWMRTLTQKGMTLGRAITFLRLSDISNRIAFADRAGISSEKLPRYEENRELPEAF